MSWIPTLTLFAMMLALGMTLRPADFARAASMPGVVAVGLLAQLVLQPLFAFGLARGLELSPTLAIGLVLIAACPGGVVSNALVQLARGDVAVSVVLTGLSSLVSFVSLPAAVALAMRRSAARVRRSCSRSPSWSRRSSGPPRCPCCSACSCCGTARR